MRLSVLFFFVSEGWGRNRINAIRDSGLVGEVGSVRIGRWWSCDVYDYNDVFEEM